MIRRETASGLTLISQVDHAYLAARLAACWGNADVPPLPLSSSLLQAVARHDDGWQPWEAAPDLDDEIGQPLNFTEMPMDVATDIWSRSIARCSHGMPSAARAMNRITALLREQGSELQADMALVLDCVLRQPDRFTVEAAVLACGEEGVPPEQVARFLPLLEEAGVLTSRRWTGGARLYDLNADLSRRDEAPLPGIWVSRHFTWLAGQALEHREDGAEREILQSFLQAQEQQREQWTIDALREAAGDELERLVETGYRYVQFFDRLSLWLCCSALPEPLEARLPGGQTFELEASRPAGAGHAGNGRTETDASSEFQRLTEPVTVTISPWPLSVPRLVLTVPAIQTTRQRYDDADRLQQELAQADPVPLTWEVVGG